MGTVANLSVKIGANTQDFNAGLQSISGQMQGVGSRMAAIGTAIAGAFSINAIGAAASQALEAASRIADMAQRVGISAEAVQQLQFAATQSGGSFEAIATSIRVMSDHLVGGDSNAVTALATLGLSLEQIRAMAPDQAFLTIANAIAALPDPMQQLAIGTDLFGRGFQQLLPAMKEGFADVAATAPVMSNAMIAAADQTGDKWAEMQLKIQNLKAEALLPLMGAFLELPQSVQVGVAGIAAFMPSLEGIGIAILAAGGPKAAMALLGTAFTSFGSMFAGIPTLLAGGLAFFTTTLPTAFLAVITFLGPQGLIALAVIALGLVWYKWGDQISGIAQKVYTAVKLWLLDKFTDVVNGIKAKVGSITGFFSDMYEKVVGHSYVPDMVSRIGEEFTSLDRLMVKPTQYATSAVNDCFKGLAGSLDGWVKNMLGSLGGFGNILNGILPSLGGILSGGIGSLVGAGIGWVGGKIGDWITGGEEAKSVNPARDRYLSQFGGGGTGAGSGFGNLAARLTEITGEGGGGSLFGALKEADTMSEFNAATSAINAILAQHPTQQPANVNVTVGTVVTPDADRFTQDLLDAIRRNEGGLRTQLTDMLVTEPVFTAY